jgi:hypothetical protein
MKPSKMIFGLMFITLLLLALSCSFGRTLPATKPAGDQIATSAAATMAAQSAPTSLPPTSPAPTSPPTPIPPTAVAIIHRIVYTDGGDVWQITAPNPPLQLTSSGNAVDVKISDDGQRVAFIRYDSIANVHEIWAVNATGGSETLLLDQFALDALHPLNGALHIAPYQLEFLPESHDLLMNTQGVFEGPGLALYEDLLQLNANSGAVTELLPPQQGGSFSIAPDGSQVALVQPTSLGLANSDGSDLRGDLVTFPSIITYSEFLYHPPVVWAPNSSAVGMVIPSQDPLAPATSGTVWRVPASGASATSLATISGDFYFPQLSGGALISPDLSKVVFERETAPNLYDLYHASADGSAETIYDSGEIQWLGWAPGGDHFVYAKGSMNIYLGRIGMPPMMLATGMDLRWVSGTRYLYLSGSYGSWTLVRGEMGAGNTALVSPAGEFVSFDAN